MTTNSTRHGITTDADRVAEFQHLLSGLSPADLQRVAIFMHMVKGDAALKSCH